MNTFEHIFEYLPDAVLVVGRDGRIALANGTAERMFAYGRGELVGQSVDILVPQALAGAHAEHRARFAARPRTRWMSSGMDLAGRRRGGEEFPVDIMLASIEADSQTAALCVVRDLSPHREARGNVRRSVESELRSGCPDAILGAAAPLFFVYDLDIRGFTFANEPAREILAGTPDSRPVYFIRDYLSRAGSCARFEEHEACWATMGNLDVHEDEIALAKADGTLRQYLVRAVVFRRRKDGSVKEVLGCLYDISDLQPDDQTTRVLNETLERRIRERTARLESLNAELQWINHELDAFSYGVAHDLRGPLTRIGGFAALLREDVQALVPGGDALRKIQVITREAERMAKMIEALLRFSRLANQSLVKRSVDMRALVESIAADLEQTAAAHVHIGALPPCDADQQLLSHVLTNLLGNAIKFSRKRDNPLVEVGSNVVDGEAAYFVRDNGIGFDPKFAGQLFGPFKRLHGPDDDYEGVGIGLVLARRIVERHGGRIWAESMPDAGATFWFTLGGEVASPTQPSPNAH